MYILKQYNNIVAKFNLYRNIDGDCVVSDLEIINENLLPLNMGNKEEKIARWLKHRTIPSNRENVDSFLFRFGLNYKDTIGIINICKGLSLNDSYWVTDEDFDGDFYKYNLYSHKISRTLSYIAFTGYGNKSIRTSLILSPEFTTNGMLAKCWRKINGKLYLYKSGTKGFSNAGREPYSEFYAYQIAKTMGLDSIEYNLSYWKGYLCSTCELFTDIDTSYIPIGRLIDNCKISKVLDYYKYQGEDLYNSLISMFVFDAIICNTDRHFGNFGVLVDNLTNTVVKPAPIFDNGLSLFNYALDEELENVELYAKTRTPAAYVGFVEFVKPLMGSVQKAQLRKLINFRFKKHPRYNLNDKRLKNIEKFIQLRVKELLD